MATKEREVSAPALEQLLLDYRVRIGHARMPETVRVEALRQLERLATTPAEGFEHYVIRGYLEAVVELPWPERAAAERRLLDTLLTPEAAPAAAGR